MKTLGVIFLSVFVAELGDKTQLATLLFATDPNVSRVGVFLASAGALMVSSLIAVLLGSQVARFVTPATLHLVAGIGFVAIGVWMLINKA
jgi:putative Ca2+/H+ antiporter (TMEM165/GDT1 family)